MANQEQNAVIAHNGRKLAVVDNCALEFDELICSEMAVLFYALKAMVSLSGEVTGGSR